MSVLIEATVIVTGVAIAIGALVGLRTIIPAGGAYTQIGRAGAIFGVLGTAFAVLLAFVIFLAFQSYARAQAAAGQEAVAVTDLARSADLIGSPARPMLRGELLCYARTVVADEWPAMAAGRQSSTVEDWIDRFQGTIDGLQVATPKQAVALSQWLAQASERRQGRRERLSEATAQVPVEVWLVLLAGGAFVLATLLAFADPAERLFLQCLLIGGTTVLVVGSLLLVRFLDHPFGRGAGSIRPTAMQLAISQLERSSGQNASLCDRVGRVSSG